MVVVPMLWTGLAAAIRAGHPATVNSYSTLPVGGDSSTYLSGTGRLGYNPSESALRSSNAHFLQQQWVASGGTKIYSQPALVNGVVYVPTWGGYLEALNASSGAQLYSTFLGTQSYCAGVGIAGIASSPTIVGSTLYVGGAGGKWLAVDTSNGSTNWSLTTGSPSNGFFNWASPLLVQSEEYVGLASSCDKPLVPAAVLAINVTTRHIDARFNTTLNGSRGASVWSSPAYDPDHNLIFVTTGNPSANASSKPYSESVLSLRANSLQLVGAWQVPTNRQVADGDFGATPTIVDTGGHSLVVALNKNGYVYAWNRTNLSAGPQWQVFVGASGHNIAPAAFDGTRLYVGVGSPLRVHQHFYNGSLWALDPATGNVDWMLPLRAPVFTAPYTANGIVVVASGQSLFVVDASSGKIVKTLTLASGAFSNAPLISHGLILAGTNTGQLCAFGLPSSKVPAPLTAHAALGASTDRSSMLAVRGIGRPEATGRT